MNDPNEIKEALRNGGFYDNNHIWNSLIKLPADDHLYRRRVETIIIRNGKEVFIKTKPNGEYMFPGGSTEKDISDIKQAENECHEEAHMNLKNLEDSGIDYKIVKKPNAWVYKTCPIAWDGYYTRIYVGEYDGPYTGKVDKEDEDPMIRSGSWIPLKQCFQKLKPYHNEALSWYLKKMKNDKKENMEMEESAAIFNYFGNKKLLKKFSRNPDISMNVVNDILDKIKKEYQKFSAKSSIRRERKKKDVGTIFHPAFSFDFPDGNTICIAFCFDDNEFTEGAAFHTDEYGDIIAIYPKFFTRPKDAQVYCLLHEIGHIRLDHLNNGYPFSSHYDDMRLNKMKKGNSIYTEINADLYAVLNGASMYTILGSSEKKDQDDEYDYRFTNAELASRYTNVFKQYQKLRSNKEVNEETMDNLKTNGKTILYEMVYTNENSLTKREKDLIYPILEKYCVDTIRPEELVIEDTDDTIEFFVKERNAEKALIEHKMELLKNAMQSIGHNNPQRYALMIESISAKERREIPLNKFGIKEERKYPLDTRQHVLSAIKLFGHCAPQYEEELAHKILRTMSKYGIPRDIIGEKNRIRKYM